MNDQLCLHVLEGLLFQGRIIFLVLYPIYIIVSFYPYRGLFLFHQFIGIQFLFSLLFK